MDQTQVRSKKGKKRDTSTTTDECENSSVGSQCQTCIIQLPPGPKGDTGTSILSGSGPPTNGYGTTGDTYVDTISGQVWRNINGQWVPTSENLRGPQGPQGPPPCLGFGRMYIDYTQDVNFDLSVNWTPLDTIDWVIDYNSYNVSLVQNTTFGFSMLQVNLDGVYEVVCDAAFDTEDRVWYRLVSTTSGPIPGTYGTDDGGDNGSLRLNTSTIIWAPAGTAFYLDCRAAGNRTWIISYASLRAIMLYPSNTFTVAP